MSETITYEGERLSEPDSARAVRRGPVDVPFMVLTLLLLGIGVICVLSASYVRAYYNVKETEGNPIFYFFRQAGFAVGGVVAMFVASRMPVTFYRKWSYRLMILSVLLLVAVLAFGSIGGGAKRWLGYKSFSFQPSEIAKIAVVFCFARMICRYGDRMRRFRDGVLPFLGILAVVGILLVAEPHLSATVIVFAVGVVMMFLGGAKIIWFVVPGLLGTGVGYLLVTRMGYAADRISAWRNPFEDASDTGYQIVQSLYAIGSGGLTGLGFGQSRQKYLYLPEEHNDFIFSVVCEELGFIGAVLILVLFALLIVRGYWLAMHAGSKYGLLVCAGLTTKLALQVFLNVAVVTSLIPCTGISLPFFSYGGTALIIQMAEMGVILSISRDIPAARD